MTLAQVQFLIDRCDVEALLRFIGKQGLREEGRRIHVPRRFKESAALKAAIDWLCSEADYERVTIM